MVFIGLSGFFSGQVFWILFDVKKYDFNRQPKYKRIPNFCFFKHFHIYSIAKFGKIFSSWRQQFVRILTTLELSVMNWPLITYHTIFNVHTSDLYLCIQLLDLELHHSLTNWHQLPFPLFYLPTFPKHNTKRPKQVLGIWYALCQLRTGGFGTQCLVALGKLAQQIEGSDKQQYVIKCPVQLVACSIHHWAIY